MHVVCFQALTAVTLNAYICLDPDHCHLRLYLLVWYDNAFLRGLECSKTLAKIAKLCSDWARAWPASSKAPPNARLGWDKGALKFMKFGAIIALILKDKFFWDFFTRQEDSHFGFCAVIFILQTFDDFKMHKNSQNFAHMSELINISIDIAIGH